MKEQQKLLLIAISAILMMFITGFIIAKMINHSNEKPKGEYRLTYVVYYPNVKPDTITVIIHQEVYSFSHEGTNYIGTSFSRSPLVSTTAIIRILNQTKVK